MSRDCRQSRFLQNMCECCHKIDYDLMYCQALDEYLCEDCIMTKADSYFMSRYVRSTATDESGE